MALLWRWTQRRILVEESDWRASCGHYRRRFWVSSHPTTEPLQPDQLAELYRQLRKAHEDGRDQPGANDFYYGELDMRRHAAPPMSAERLLLSIYWLASGYGLRSLRAAACLAALIVICAVGLLVWGFRGGNNNFADALIYASQGAVSIEPRSTSIEITPTGDAFRLLMRVGGPLFIGLTILAVRNQLKR